MKTQMKTRIFAIVLCLSTLISCLPLSAIGVGAASLDEGSIEGPSTSIGNSGSIDSNESIDTDKSDDETPSTDGTPCVEDGCDGVYQNGICSVCGGYEEATLVDGVYRIANAGNLYWFAAEVNGGDKSICAKLTKNIIVNSNVLKSDGTLNNGEFKDWTPIGTYGKRYAGTFDGDGHTVSGLYLNDSAKEYVGLVGYLDGGTVQNIGIVDSYFCGKQKIGGVVGNNYDGTIKNCYNAGTIVGSYKDNRVHVGGVVGYVEKGTIESCHNTGTVKGTGTVVGGVAGYIVKSSVKNCYNIGTVSGEGRVGGVVGRSNLTNDNDTVNVTNCFNTGAVSGNSDVGGVVGYGTTSFSSSTSSSACVNITNCYNTGEVSATNERNPCAGGVIGYIGSRVTATATNCYYLDSSAESAAGEGTLGGDASAATVAQFSSGEVAYLLNGSTSDGTLVWKQTLGTDKTPNFTSTKIVYKFANCVDSVSYANEQKSDGAHDYQNGICTNAGCTDPYQAPSTDADGVYQIANAGNLYWFANFVNQGGDNLKANAKLTADITVNPGKFDKDGNYTEDGASATPMAWTPIGSETNAYKGTFDGNNKYISGLYFNDASKNCVGLFGEVHPNGTVKNVAVKDFYIKAGSNVGGLVGRNHGSISNCMSSGTVIGTYYNVGGVVGINDSGTVTNCMNTGTVSGWASVGGVVGINDSGTVTNCYYLNGCATDGDAIVQYGIGNETRGSTTADVAGQTESKTANAFASGEVTYLLNGGVTDGTQAWYQTCGEGAPAFSGDTVYKVKNIGCTAQGTYKYSNTNEAWSPDHASFDADGFCTVCGGYEKPSGKGTADDPYIIKNAGQLYWFAAEVNSGKTTICGKLGADIIVNSNVLKSDGTPNSGEFRVWTPIGNNTNTYNGTFDGTKYDESGENAIGNYIISGLYFNDTSKDCVGLFGYVGDGGKVTDVVIKDSYIKGRLYVGGVAGWNCGKILRCSSSVTVSGSCYVGGIAGSTTMSGNEMQIVSCTNYGTVTADGTSNYVYAGGIVGNVYLDADNAKLELLIEHCCNAGTVTATANGTYSNAYAGGIVGNAYALNVTLNIRNCYNTGAVTGSNYVGGVVGYNYNGMVTNCYNTGSVTCSGSSSGGAVIDYNIGTLTNCYYLKGTAPSGVGIGSGVAVEVTETQLKSGEVTYLLNGGVTDGTQAWYQTLSGEDKQSLPSYSGETVYYGYTSCSESATAHYTNDWQAVSEKPGHSVVITSNGNNTHTTVCENCGDVIGEANVACTFDSDHFCTVCYGEHVHTKGDDGFCTVCGRSATEPAKDEKGVYLIYTTSELYWFAEQVNRKYGAQTEISAKLMANICVNNGKFDENGNYTVNGVAATPRDWTPIANGYAYYYASFDGNGYTVSGLYCNQTYGNVGFFAQVGAFEVKDLHIANSYFAGNYAGAIAGYTDGTTVERCSAAADVYVKGNNYAGGIVGYNCGTINNCYSLAKIADNGTWGGLAGYNYGNISSSFTTAMQPVGYGGSLTNVYYAEDTRDYSTPGEDGYTPVKPTFKGAVEVTEAEFKSGKITWLLNGESSDGVWKQNFSIDSHPTLENSLTVYKKINDGCSAAEDRFSNTENERFSAEHVYDTNGFCKCGAYEPAKLVDGVYEIANAGQLYWFAAKVNSGSTSINAKLTADITVNSDVLNSDGSLNTGDFREWTPIKYYQGTFDGNGKYISGLYYNNAEAQYVGLFGTVYNSGVVKNVTVKDSYFCGLSAVGGVVASNYGTVENCHNSGSTVIGEARFVEDRENGFNLTDGRVGYYAYGNNIGGVVGTNTGTLKNCTNSGSVSGYANVGGVVGYNCKDVESCTNSGKVTGKYIRYAYYEKDVDGNLTADTNDIDYGDCVGGVVGFTVGGAVKNCRNTGAVSGYAYVGGVVGHSTECAIGNCYNTASVAGNSGVGGVVGLNYGTVSNCYNSGTVSGYVNVGGVVGYNRVDTVTNCYYLKGTATNGIGYGDGEAFVVTEDQLKSGEVAYKLNGDQSTIVWYQTCGEGAPAFEGKTVYHYTNCCGGDGYTNDSTTESGAHDYDKDGFCRFNDTHYQPGEKDASGVYLIKNAGNLYWFAAEVNSGNTNINGKLTDNIKVNDNVLVNGALNSDTSDFRAWTPIGYSGKKYTGTFDGNGKTVSGLYYNNAEVEYAGLFGVVGADGTVKNVAVKDSYIKGEKTVGGVVGQNNGTVANCYNSGTIGGTGYYVGGVVGFNSGEITNCMSTGSVSGRNYVGGVVGYNQNVGYITNCMSTGKVTCEENVGGVVGHNSYEFMVTNCYYLKGTASVGIGDDGSGEAIEVTEDQLTSGEITWLLNGKRSEGTTIDPLIWKQTLDGKSYPGFVGGIVYKMTNTGCSTAADKYSNTDGQSFVGEHSFDKDGFCKCGAYEPCEGKGTTVNPYLIKNAGNLYWFVQYVNKGGSQKNAKLTANIVINSGTFDKDGTYTPGEGEATGTTPRPWTPISSYAGSDTFDGDDYTISGLYYNNGADEYVGLFGQLVGTVKDLGIVNCYINASHSDSQVGGVVGQNGGTVENCAVSGTVSGNLLAGGIVGWNVGNVTGCMSTGTVSGENFVGGVVAYNFATVTNCYSTSTVSGEFRVGGIVGCNQNTVTNCYGAGEVIGGADSTIGGVAGQNESTGTITNCYYLDTCASKGIGAGDGEATAMTDAQLKSGEVTWLLNGKKSEGIWKQTLDGDSYPGFTGDTVYCGYNKCDETVRYSNLDGLRETPHDYKNGICTQTDGQIHYEPASLVDGYYEISNLGQLLWFAAKVNGGETSINGKLMNDIDATSVSYIGIGKDANHAFAGTFDGNNKTLKIVLVSTEQYVAPFPYVNGATIKSLTVSGTIKTTHKFAAGIVGRVQSGNAKFENCLSLVEIDSTKYSGDGTHGGLIGVVGEGSTTTINNCGFAGSIIGTTTTSCAGIVGWTDKNAKTNISNSYVAATFTLQGNSGNTFGRNPTYVSLNNCYYLNALNDPSVATQMSADSFASGEVAYKLGGAWKQTIGTDDYPNFTGKDVNYGYELCAETKSYTNAQVYAEITHEFDEKGFCNAIEGQTHYQPAVLNGGVYEISNAGQLFWFANYVNSGNAGANAKLMADIDLEGRLWTPIGLYSDDPAISKNNNQYIGTFDGNYHIIKNLYVEMTENYEAGLFSRVATGGVIKNLGVVNATVKQNKDGHETPAKGVRAGIIAGEIYRATVENVFTAGELTLETKHDQFGGLAGECKESNLTNCYTTMGILTDGREGNTPSSVTNCFYCADSANANSVGANMTEAQVKSGELAYTLGSEIWKQTVGEGYPTFDGETVYRYNDCKGTSHYTNTETADIEHDFDDDGFCKLCDGYEPCEFKDGVYLIKNAGNLYWFAAEVNSGNTTINGKLMGDITVNPGKFDADGNYTAINGETVRAWTPIGGENSQYTGTFDGNGKTVSGLYYNDLNSQVGLFGYVGKNGTVKNVAIKDSYTHCLGNVGGVVGDNYGSVINCYNSGMVFVQGATAGGVVGYNEGTITNCYNSGMVGGVGTFVGGVAGMNHGTITNCYNTGTVSGMNIVGGVVGDGSDGITNCYYLKGTANVGIGDGSGEAIEVTEDQLTSGEITWLLNGKSSAEDVVWKQTLDGKSYPGFVGDTVYCNYTNCKDTEYSNTQGSAAPLHDYTNNNGFCKVCGTYEPCELKDGVYLIKNAGNLYWFAALVNGTLEGVEQNKSANAKLTANITVNPGKFDKDGKYIAKAGETVRVWTPIGTDAQKSYQGTFDGTKYDASGENAIGNYTISGLYYNDSTADYVGLFGYVGFGTVKNVTVTGSYLKGKDYVGLLAFVGNNNTVENVTVTASRIEGNDYVGGVAGNNNGTITNCSNSATVSGNKNVGGVVGYNQKNGNITNCSNSGAVTGSGNYIGGVVGYNKGTVTTCMSTGTVSGTVDKSCYIGGVVGYNDSTGKITDCYNTGEVSGTGSYSSYVGGVVGYNNAGNITDCYNTGEVSGTQNDFGGVVGYNTANGTIATCYNTGKVSGAGSYSSYVGGVVGRNLGNITTCYNTGTVTGNNNYVGGVVGRNLGNITTCYNTGTVTGNNNYVGGVAGKNTGTVSNCYYLTDCAKDVTGTVQYGIGNQTPGSKTEDTEGVTAGKTKAEFTSGEITWLLNGEKSEDDVVWKQTLGKDDIPNFTGDIVYRYTDCQGKERFANKSTDNGSHVYDADGFCACGAYQPCEGEGTAEKPYLIKNAGNLYWFAEKVNNGNTAINAKLTANITVNKDVLRSDGTSNTGNFREWTPIGNYSYTGTFDGNGKTISGLYYNGSDNYVGLFGKIEGGATIKNVTLTDTYFESSVRGEVSNSYVGGIAGYVYVTDNNTVSISGCTISGTVTATADGFSLESYADVSAYAGGLVGYACAFSGGTLKIERCCNTGTVTATANGDSGGTFNYANAYTYSGGLVGYAYAVSGVTLNIENCYNTGDVSATADGKDRSDAYSGGLVGYAYNLTLNRCYYLYTSAADAFGKSYEMVTEDVERMTEEEFKSGKVTWLLNGEKAEGTDESPLVWFQTIGIDDYPSFNGMTVYFESENYTNKDVEFVGYTLTLDGNIGVNFYTLLSKKFIDGKGYIEFKINGRTIKIEIENARQSGIYYIFTVPVYAYEMNLEIEAKAYLDDSVVAEDSESVRDYASHIINHPDDYTEDDIAFAKALLNYGAAAQKHFDVNTDDLANKAEGLETGTVTELKANDLKKYDAPSQSNDFGKFYGFNLRLYNMTCLNVYFRPTEGCDIDDFTFKVNGKEATIEKLGEYYRLACDDIRAYQLDEEMTFEATYGEVKLTYKCSAMSYCYSVLMQETDEVYTDALKELVCALREYQVKSEIYGG